MWTKRRAWPGNVADPPFPTSQKPNLATLAPAHAASAQPHQYVTPSAPQTGSVRKHFAGHDDGVVTEQTFCDGNRRTDDSSCSAVVMIGKMMMRAMKVRMMENFGMVSWRRSELRWLAGWIGGISEGKFWDLEWIWRILEDWELELKLDWTLIDEFGGFDEKWEKEKESLLPLVVKGECVFFMFCFLFQFLWKWIYT